MFPTLAYLLILASNPGYKTALGTSSVQLGTRSFSLENRYDVPSVSTIFKDNILLTLHYMSGDVTNRNQISWDNIEKPFRYEFTLQPGQEFAFHDNALPAYSKNIVKTTNAHFMSNEGFKSDGYLVGDGVCHFASLISWAARDAGLDVYVPARHDFAKINDVPKEYGVSINSTKAYGNLYITNNKSKPVTFDFDYDGTNLTVTVNEAKGDKAS